MRAIIIDDKDCKALLEKLELESMKESIGHLIERHYAEWYKIPENTRKFIIDSLHRKFHYHVCEWLQDQGGRVT